MRSPAQTVAASLPAVAKRKASRPSTDASPFSAQSNGCLPARKRRTQDVCRRSAPRRVAPSERRDHGEVLDAARLVEAQSDREVGAPRVGRRRGDDVDGPGLAAPRRRRRDDVDPERPVHMGRV